MENGNKLTEYKTVRRFLKKELNGDVTKELVEELQSVLEDYLRTICENISEEQWSINWFREIQGLSKLKRYGVSTYLNCVGEVFEPTSDGKGKGKVAKLENTILSDRESMEVV